MKRLQKNYLKVLELNGLFALLIIVAFGCASIVKGNKQQISFRSSPTGAKLKVYDREEKMIINEKTPHMATLKCGRGFFKKAEYRVTIEKEGYETKKFHIKGYPSGWYLGGNFIFGGLIGWLIVDPITGAMWTLSPKEIDADFTEASTFLNQDKGLMIVLKEDLPINLLPKMKPLNLYK